MATDDAVKQLDELVKQFSRNLCWYRMQAAIARKNFHDNYHELMSIKGGVPEKDVMPYLRMSHGLMAFDLVDVSKLPIPFGRETVNYVGIEYGSLQGLNAQLRWWLVIAYERYERYLKDLYALLGYHDRNIWRCSHFGNISVSEIEGMDLEWFKTKVNNVVAKDDVTEIQKALRQCFENVACGVHPEWPGFTVDQWIDIVGILRHRIVHREGRVKLPEFWDSVGRKLGVGWQGKQTLKPEQVKEMLYYLDQDRGEPQVWLIDNELMRNKSNAEIEWKLGKPLELLASHGLHMYKKAVEHFGESPLHEREP